MILQDILAFLRARRVAGVAEIARAVDSTPEAVRSMLQTLEGKGLAHRCTLPSGCGTRCRQCGQAEMELYCPGRQADDSVSGSACEVLAPDWC